MGAVCLRGAFPCPSPACDWLIMAMTAYTGVQGSGKSFEVVSSVILGSLAAGRRVVTNVAGLKPDLIAAYVEDKFGVPAVKQGLIVQISNEDVTKDWFFPLENGLKHKAEVFLDAEGKEVENPVYAKSRATVEKDSIVQGGDVIILDECWRWYGTGEKLLPSHMMFFRMHRHFLHPATGVSCDLVFVVQDIGDLQRKVKATIEKTFWMKKHKDLGFENRYVVNIYSGNALRDKALTESIQKEYKPEIFALYSSYSQSQQATGKEVNADKRGNLLNRKIFKYAIPVGILWIFGAGWFMWRFFHPEQNKPVDTAKTVSASAAPVGGSSPPGQLPDKPKSNVSDEWKLVGFYELGGSMIFVMTDGARIRNISNPPMFKFSPGELELILPSGEVVTRWSGRRGDNPRVGL